MKRNVWLAGVAVIFLVVVFLLARGTRGVEVAVARAERVGGQAGTGVGITANGYVVARTKASVSSKISGRLAYLGVEEGSVVRRGEVIARLENDDYRAVVEQAEAEVQRERAGLAEVGAQRDQLRRDLTRAQALLRENLVSQQEVEDLSARVTAAGPGSLCRKPRFRRRKPRLALQGPISRTPTSVLPLTARCCARTPKSARW